MNKLERRKPIDSVKYDPVRVKQLIVDLEPIFDDLESELKGKENGRFKAGYNNNEFLCSNPENGLYISTIQSCYMTVTLRTPNYME